MSGKFRKYFVSILIICFALIISTNTYASEKDTEIIAQVKEYNNSENVIIPYSVQDKNEELRAIKAKLSASLSLGVDKYDLRDYIRINVKDQSRNGCWASSAASMYETHLALKYGIDVEISTRHMEYATSQSFLYGETNPFGFDREVDTSGSMLVSLSYFVNGCGPILEQEMPFSENFERINLNEIKNKNVIRKLDDYVMFPSIYKEKSGNNIIYKSSQQNSGTTYQESMVEQIRNKIKLHIMTNGAVGCGIIGSKNELYFNEATNSFYSDDLSQRLDHQVTIIGWDDNYPVQNFKTGKQPKNPGAYIALNSWGENFGESGIFYISYEDAFVESFMMGIENSSEVTYDKIYQYDPLGMSAATQLVNANSSGTPYEEIYGANVFIRNSGEVEYLTEVGVSTLENTKCEVYVNPSNGSLADRNFIKVELGYKVQMDPGYHTIKLKEPIQLTGDEFCVAVKYYEVDENRGAFATLERPLQGSYWGNAEASRGESFLGIDLDSMQDIVEMGFANTNLCVKAFTSRDKDAELSSKKIDVKSINFNNQKRYDDIVSEFTVELQTKNIENGSTLEIEILQDNLIMTDNFNIIGNTINDNNATITIGVRDVATSATYTLQICYENLVVTRQLIYEKPEIVTEPEDPDDNPGTEPENPDDNPGTEPENPDDNPGTEPEDPDDNPGTEPEDPDDNPGTEPENPDDNPGTDPDEPITTPVSLESDIYEIDNVNKIITKIPFNTTSEILKRNIRVNGEMKIFDLDSNELYDRAIVGTSMELKINEKESYKLVIRGDLNGDGKLTITDLSKMKAFIVNLFTFNDKYMEMAADINYSNNITVTDLSQIKMMLVGNI